MFSGWARRASPSSQRSELEGCEGLGSLLANTAAAEEAARTLEAELPVVAVDTAVVEIAGEADVVVGVANVLE